MFDSSKYDNFREFSNHVLANIIKKIPVQEQKYQKNGTCWGNAICANNSLLKNYTSYNQIVNVKSIQKEIISITTAIYTFKPQKNVIENIIKEANENLMKIVKKIHDKKKYIKIYDNNKIIIKSNTKIEQLYQEPLNIFKSQQCELESKELIQKEKEFKQRKENIYQQLKQDEISSIEEFNKIYEEYKQDKMNFKILKNRLDLIVIKKEIEKYSSIFLECRMFIRVQIVSSAS